MLIIMEYDVNELAQIMDLKPFEPRGHWDRKLMVNIVELSESDNYDDARLEWRATGRVFKRSRNIAMNERLERMAEEWGHPVGLCVCGHSVVYHYEIVNAENGNITVLGSDHITNYHIARYLIDSCEWSIRQISTKDVQKWRKSTEHDMAFNEWKASDEGTKFYDRLNLVSEIDTRYNGDSVSYRLNQEKFADIYAEKLDVFDMATFLDFRVWEEAGILDAIELTSNGYKKTPSLYSSDEYITKSSVILRTRNHVELRGKKPPASLLADIASLRRDRREAFAVIENERKVLRDILEIAWARYFVHRVSQHMRESSRYYSVELKDLKDRLNQLLRRKANFEKQKVGRSNKNLLEALSEEDKEELLDYGVLQILENRPDDYMYYHACAVQLNYGGDILNALSKSVLEDQEIILKNLEVSIKGVDESISTEDLENKIAEMESNLDSILGEDDFRGHNNKLGMYLRNCKKNRRFGTTTVNTFFDPNSDRFHARHGRDYTLEREVLDRMYYNFDFDAEDRKYFFCESRHRLNMYNKLYYCAEEICSVIWHNFLHAEKGNLLPTKERLEEYLSVQKQVIKNVEGLNTEQTNNEVN